MAQELLQTFEQELNGVLLQPGAGGIFVIRIGQTILWSRTENGGFPEIKELKRRVRDSVAPGRGLGHIDP